MIFLFNDNKSKKFVFFSVGAVLVLILILILAFFIKGGNNYTTVKLNETYRVGNKNLKVFGINKSKDFLYLEFIDEDWINNNSNFKFTAFKKKESNKEINNILKIKYKGYYLIKIPLEKGYGSVKLITNYDNKNYQIYFNEHQIEETDYQEPSLKEYKVMYLKEIIRSIGESMAQKHNDIAKENKKIDDLEKEIEEVKAELDFLQGEELQKRKSHLKSLEVSIENIKDTILNFKNDLIKYGNKIEIIETEITFLETGIREHSVLEDLKDKNGNIITDIDAKKYDEEITKDEITEEKRNENKNEETKTKFKIENKDTNTNYNNNNSNNYNNQNVNTENKNTNNQNTNVDTNKNKTTITTPPKTIETKNNNQNTNTENKKIIKPIKNDKEKQEVEIEFKP